MLRIDNLDEQRQELIDEVNASSEIQLRSALLSLFEQCAREDTSSQLNINPYLHTAEIYNLLRRGFSI